MRRVGLILGAVVLMFGVLSPALAQQPFADVPLDHWAYAAVNTLAEKGLIEGYPDGTFKGKQALTRYEFAQALARLMDRIETMGAGKQGPPGAPGPAGAPGAGGGLTAEQQALLDRLAKEFGPELKALRSDLDNLTKRVEDLEAKEPAKGPMITVSGDMSWRIGTYGTDLGFQDETTTGYPTAENSIWYGSDMLSAYSPYGGITLPEMFWGSLDPAVADHTLWGDDPAVISAFWEYYGVPGLGAPVGMGVIPISDALKDAYKASDFLTQRTRVIFSGPLAENTDVKVSLRAGPTTNLGDPGRGWGSPANLSGNGLMDVVQVDEAWMKYHTNLLVPAELTVGKQYFGVGQGLLANNDQEGLKGFRADWQANDKLGWGLLWGALDQEMLYGGAASGISIPEVAPLDPTDPVLWGTRTSGQDNYNLYWLNYAATPNWKLGFNWLDSGYDEEQGWSVGLDGKLYGLDLYGEYAKLTKWGNGKDWNDWGKWNPVTNWTDSISGPAGPGDGVVDPEETNLDDSDAAWLLGLKWSAPSVVATAEYGQVDAGYAFSVPMSGWSAFGSPAYLNLPFSLLHPRAEVDPHYINWVDRPLFLDGTNIARGWHLNVTFPKLLGEKTPVSVSYMTGDAYNPRYLTWLFAGGTNSYAYLDAAGAVVPFPAPDKWRDADPVWAVKVSRQLSQSVSANLVYARREVDNVMSPGTAPANWYFDQTTQKLVPQYASTDAIQVIRAEFCIAF